jgi:hypothetical protein
MSPGKKPSTIAGLRRGIGSVPASERRVSEMTDAEVQTLASPLAASTRTKPARITLNLPPGLYRQLARWADEAAETMNVPRVGVQDALRAMVSVITGDEAPSCSARVLAEVRDHIRQARA